MTVALAKIYVNMLYTLYYSISVCAYNALNTVVSVKSCGCIGFVAKSWSKNSALSLTSAACSVDMCVRARASSICLLSEKVRKPYSSTQPHKYVLVRVVVTDVENVGAATNVMWRDSSTHRHM